MQEYGNLSAVKDKYSLERTDLENINKRIDMLKQSIQSSSDDDFLKQYRSKMSDTVNQTNQHAWK